MKSSIPSKPSPQNPEVREVEPDDLWKNRDAVAIIDVRRPDEFSGELGHIPASELIVLDTLPQRLSDLPRDQAVVFVCRSGNRSAHAAAFAKEQGLANVYNLRGGMVLWNELGLTVEGRNRG